MTCNCAGCPHPTNCRCRCTECGADSLRAIQPWVPLQTLPGIPPINSIEKLEKKIEELEKELEKLRRKDHNER